MKRGPDTIAEAMATLERLARGASPFVAPMPSPGGPLSPPSPDPLRRAEARYRALVEQIPAVTFMASLEGGINEVYVSPQIEALLGFSQTEWRENPVLWFRQLHPDDRALWNREFARGCAEDGRFKAECRFLARDGHTVWVHGEARLVSDEDGRPIFMQGVAYDHTESKRAEEVVRASLREKELLLKEIHHRVKNNLQITSSLLKLQAEKVADPQLREILRDSQERVRSMALVHEMLYKSSDLSHVDFAEYAESLLARLLRSFDARPDRVTLRTDIAGVSLGVDDAVPCGLILNELVSNALKHAFPEERKGVVTVSLGSIGEGKAAKYQLSVADDGVGLPAGFNAEDSETLGMELVNTLAAQLDGQIEFCGGAGTLVRVTFPRRG